jgi:hypothetical protein
MKTPILLAALCALLTLRAPAQTPQPGSMRDRMNKAPGALGGGGLKAPGMVRSPSKPAGGASVPAPAQDKVYSLPELLASGFTLNGKVVLLKLSKPAYELAELVSEKEYRVVIKDEAFNAATPVYFPPEGAKKMELFIQTTRITMSFYVRIWPDRYTAVGRDWQSSRGIYTW